jgi:hypothetical protein
MQISSGAARPSHPVPSLSGTHSNHSSDSESGIELSRLSVESALISPVALSPREGSMLEAAQIEGMSRLESLPDDVRLLVLNLLDVRSLLHVSLTSKALLAAARTVLNARATEATGFSYDAINQAAQSILKELTNIRTQWNALGDDSTILDRVGEGTANCLTSVAKLVTLSLLAPLFCCCPCLVCCCCCAILGSDDRVDLRTATTKVDFLVASRSRATRAALKQLNKNIAKWNRRHPTEIIELPALERHADVNNQTTPKLLLGFDLSQLPDAVKPKMKVVDYRTSFDRLLDHLSLQYQETTTLQNRLLAL